MKKRVKSVIQHAHRCNAGTCKAHNHFVRTQRYTRHCTRGCCPMIRKDSRTYRRSHTAAGRTTITAVVQQSSRRRRCRRITRQDTIHHRVPACPEERVGTGDFPVTRRNGEGNRQRLATAHKVAVCGRCSLRRGDGGCLRCRGS